MAPRPKHYVLDGFKIGTLTVLRCLAPSPHWGARWLCRCACGAEVECVTRRLLHAQRYGFQANCGCAARERLTQSRPRAVATRRKRNVPIWSVNGSVAETDHKGKRVLIDAVNLTLVNGRRLDVARGGGPRLKDPDEALSLAVLGRPLARGETIVFWNSNRFDCRRENVLTVRSARRTITNRKMTAWDTASRFKGVTFHRRLKKWVARIGVNGVRRYLGTFEHEEDAARAYDLAAIKHFGDIARTNHRMGLLDQAMPKNRKRFILAS